MEFKLYCLLIIVGVYCVTQLTITPAEACPSKVKNLAKGGRGKSGRKGKSGSSGSSGPSAGGSGGAVSHGRDSRGRSRGSSREELDREARWYKSSPRYRAQLEAIFAVWGKKVQATFKKAGLEIKAIARPKKRKL